MPLLRPYAAFSSFNRRVAPRTILQPPAARPISSTCPRFAQGYGDGEGDPRGENPQDQGASNGTKHNAEHPGPAPPAEGKGTGAGPTKGGASPEDASAQSGGSRSKEAKETGSSPTGGKVGNSGGKSSSSGGTEEKNKDGASPKLADDNVPGSSNSKEKQAEVEQHVRVSSELISSSKHPSMLSSSIHQC